MFEVVVFFFANVMLTLIRACWDGCYLVLHDLLAVCLAAAAYLSLAYGVLYLLGRARAWWQRGR